MLVHGHRWVEYGHPQHESIRQDDYGLDWIRSTKGFAGSRPLLIIFTHGQTCLEPPQKAPKTPTHRVEPLRNLGNQKPDRITRDRFMAHARSANIFLFLFFVCFLTNDIDRLNVVLSFFDLFASQQGVSDFPNARMHRVGNRSYRTALSDSRIARRLVLFCSSPTNCESGSFRARDTVDLGEKNLLARVVPG